MWPADPLGCEEVVLVPPELEGGRAADFPSLSSRVRIEQSKEAGRFGVAEQMIRVGDVIAVEKPYASVMNPDKYATHCHHCYKS